MVTGLEPQEMLVWRRMLNILFNITGNTPHSLNSVKENPQPEFFSTTVIRTLYPVQQSYIMTLQWLFVMQFHPLLPQSNFPLGLIKYHSIQPVIILPLFPLSCFISTLCFSSPTWSCQAWKLSRCVPTSISSWTARGHVWNILLEKSVWRRWSSQTFCLTISLSLSFSVAFRLVRVWWLSHLSLKH